MLASISAATLLLAATSATAAPPSDAMPLSQIVQMIEQQPDFHYIDEIEWDDDGYWEVEYVTRDGSKIEVDIDPISGERR